MTNCWFIAPQTLKITIVYVYPLEGAQNFAPLAHNFVASYVANPPGMEHDTLIVCNGAPASDTSKALFNPMPNVTFIDHDNSGWDIGAFQLAARTSNADMMVFFGSSTYLRKPGWLTRMVEVFQQYGDTLYGSTGNQGDPRSNVHAHVRTTGFWCSPKLLAKYPYIATSQGGGPFSQRYEIEHGRDCISSWVIQQGLQPYIVGWDCIWPLHQCDQMPGGYHNGEQYNLLAGDRLTSGVYYPHP